MIFSMLKLVIFDFDGLLVNSEESVYSAIKVLLSKYGQEFKWSYFLENIGLPVDVALKNYHSHFKLPISLEEFVKLRNKAISSYLSDNLKLMPYAREILEYLDDRKIIMAVATSGKGDYVKYYLSKFSILKYFKTVISIDDVKRGKPYPDLINKTLTDLGIQADTAIIIEDSPVGVAAAKNAGIKIIAVPTKGLGNFIFKDADYVCKNLREAKMRITEVFGF